jgi:ABC-type multidrug transport system fused ATPase/permease subunit
MKQLSLDSESERLVQDALFRLMNEKQDFPCHCSSPFNSSAMPTKFAFSTRGEIIEAGKHEENG